MLHIMSEQTNHNFSIEAVDDCVLTSRGLQTSENKNNSNDIDIETTSPWKYPPFSSKKKGTSECSHKVIEKRRRDRINKCLADLGQIVPTAQNGKQGSGKLEKAEILELTVEYLKNLQVAANNGGSNKQAETQKAPEKEQVSCTSRELQSYSKGYSDCTSEVLRFLVTVEATDPRLPCFQRLMAHLRIQCRHLIDLPDIDNKQTTKQNTVTSSSTKTKHTGKKNNLKSETQSDGPSGKRQRIEVDSPVISNATSNGNEKAKNLTVMGFLEENSNPAYHNKGHRSVGSSSMGSSNSNINPDCINGNKSSNNNDMNGNGNNYPAQYPNNNSGMPFPNHFYPPSYGFPTYALHPAGTHYIPVALHPGIQMPGNNINGTLPAATLINPGLGFFGYSMSGLPPSAPMGSGPSPAYGPLGGGFNLGSGLGGMGTGLGGLGGMSSGLAGPGALPVYLSMAQKEQNRNRSQDSNGSSENESNSSSDEYNFSSSSSGNISEVVTQTDQPQDNSDYFSGDSR